ncbi:hypothetical protein ACFQ6O_43805 [Streptomyces sp. NPDC056441]|uniref:hypothetical protein n=1 Tax=Streptomyces sp. NPDC056441 TaxID=3345817 RepID=UPI0036977280
MADDLYTRYQQASDTWRTHSSSCESCRAGQHCPAGAPLYRRLADLQDAYLRRLRSRGEKR